MKIKNKSNYTIVYLLVKNIIYELLRSEKMCVSSLYNRANNIHLIYVESSCNPIKRILLENL